MGNVGQSWAHKTLLTNHLDEKLKRFQPGTLCFLEDRMLAYSCSYESGTYTASPSSERYEVFGPFLLIFTNATKEYFGAVGLWGEKMYRIGFWWPVSKLHIYEDYIKEQG